MAAEKLETEIRQDQITCGDSEAHTLAVIFFGLIQPGSARKLDRGERIEPEVTITFEDPLQMSAVLTASRLRLVQEVKKRAISMTALASELKRDLKSVRRDVGKLERVGVVRTRKQVNPGHGRIKIVETIAKQVRLVANLQSDRGNDEVPVRIFKPVGAVRFVRRSTTFGSPAQRLAMTRESRLQRI